MNPISRFLVRRKMKKSGLNFTRDDVMKSRPVRNTLIKWDESENGEVSLVVPQKETLPGTRGGDLSNVGVHSIRQPGRLAEHQVIFGGPGQTLILSHDTVSRDCYVPGILRAIREVVKFEGLVVGLEKLLGL